MAKVKTLAKIRTPKYITKTPKGFYVKLYSKKYNNQYCLGTHPTVEKAISVRDSFIERNLHDVMEGYTPRGISHDRSVNQFVAFITLKNKNHRLGSFKTIEEAINFRKEFLTSII